MNENKMLFLVYGYFALSMLWSDVPFVSLKRIFKDFGCVLVALVFLTQSNPVEAIRLTFVRVSYLLFPLSLLFIKYFPQIGRNQSRSGDNMFTGVTTQKNSLGQMVFVLSLMIIWDLAEIWRDKNPNGRKLQIGLRIGMLAIGLWLLAVCDSQTSLLCLILGTLTFCGGGRLLQMRNGKQLLITGLIVTACSVILDKSLGISDALIRAMGRDPSLTGRTDIWRLVLEQKTDVLLGNGFYTFWDSDKGHAVMDAFMAINSAHNGFLEMYLDGGLLGAGLIVILLLVVGTRVINRLFAGNPLGRMGLVFWLLAILYNFSESSFLRLDLLWFSLIVMTLNVPSVQKPSFSNVRSFAGRQEMAP